MIYLLMTRVQKFLFGVYKNFGMWMFGSSSCGYNFNMVVELLTILNDINLDW